MKKNMKKQDIPTIGGMLLSAFARNKSDFIAFSDIFDGSFEADMADAIKAVRDRRRPADVFDKQKKVTVELYETMDEIQETLRMLSEYVKMAAGTLLTLYDDYHIKEAREALFLRDAEGVIEHSEIVLDKIVNDDSAALNAVGLDSGKISAFEALIAELINKNEEQNDMMDIRREVRGDEIVLFEALFDFIDKIASVGKAIYTYKDKHKYDEFSVNHILGRINHGRKHGEDAAEDKAETPVYDVMIGRVTDKTSDSPLENVVVRIEGTKVMTDTDVDGEFYLDEIPEGVYTVSFSKNGYVSAEQHNVVIGTSEMQDLRVELLPESQSSAKAS